jgi:hypothetical protein
MGKNFRPKMGHGRVHFLEGMSEEFLSRHTPLRQEWAEGGRCRQWAKLSLCNLVNSEADFNKGLRNVVQKNEFSFGETWRNISVRFFSYKQVAR